MAEPSGQPEKFFVDRLPEVSLQIRRLVARARQLGYGKMVLDCLEAIVTKLETMPLEWGDPEYSTKLEDGVVMHGLQFPLIAQYVTFQQQYIVCILKISVFPRHPLEAE